MTVKIYIPRDAAVVALGAEKVVTAMSEAIAPGPWTVIPALPGWWAVGAYRDDNNTWVADVAEPLIGWLLASHPGAKPAGITRYGVVRPDEVVLFADDADEARHHREVRDGLAARNSRS